MNSTDPVLTPALLAAAEKLAETVGRVEPIAAFQQAKARYDADAEVQALVEQYGAARRDLQIRQTGGEERLNWR